MVVSIFYCIFARNKLNMNSGIYKIVNLQTDKYYVGSTKDFKKRKQNHFSGLKNNYHPNKHLQNAYNKYGADNFKFEIIEYVKEELLLDIEQSYLDDSEIESAYNKTYIAGAGGYDNLSISVYLLDLEGNIIKEYESIMEASRNLKTLIANYRVNTDAIIRSKYRLVSKEFYNNNLEFILTWSKITNPVSTQLKIDKENFRLKRIIIYNNKEYISKEVLAEELPISLERIRQILVSGKSKKYNIKYKYPELQ